MSASAPSALLVVLRILPLPAVSRWPFSGAVPLSQRASEARLPLQFWTVRVLTGSPLGGLPGQRVADFLLLAAG